MPGRNIVTAWWAQKVMGAGGGRQSPLHYGQGTGMVVGVAPHVEREQDVDHRPLDDQAVVEGLQYLCVLRKALGDDRHQ